MLTALYIVLGILGALFLLVVAFLLWQILSVYRGARSRDEQIVALLLPILVKLRRNELVTPNEPTTPNEPVTADEVATLAAMPHVRTMLYASLHEFGRLDLFPSQYLDQPAQGEARLAYWMMHPHELAGLPEQIELVETVTRPLNPNGGKGKFFVYRYRMPPGHWAGTDWLLGLAGPYFDDDPPYDGPAGAFSRADDKYGFVQPADLIDWYIDAAAQKGAPWIER